MSILELILGGGYKSVAVVGMAKNTGKTTTLNHMIKEAAASGGGQVMLGLITAGRDGEKTDILTNLPKPVIVAPTGALFATAEQVLPRCEARLELVEDTAYITQLGRVSIYRVEEAGAVELVGPDTAGQLRHIIRRMRDLGAALVLADGAFDRRASASPAIVEAAILATGAALSPDMATTIAWTSMVARLLQLRRPADRRLEAAARKVIAERRVAVIDTEYRTRYLDVGTALGNADKVTRAVAATRTIEGAECLALACGRSVTGEILTALTSKAADGRKVELVVGDGTRLFVEPEEWRRFTAAGGRVTVLNPIRLLAVTVNPYSPVGPSYNPADFLAKVGRAVTPIPAFDLGRGP